MSTATASYISIGWKTSTLFSFISLRDAVAAIKKIQAHAPGLG
jgi:hypothetical protein